MSNPTVTQRPRLALALAGLALLTLAVAQEGCGQPGSAKNPGSSDRPGETDGDAGGGGSPRLTGSDASALEPAAAEDAEGLLWVTWIRAPASGAAPELVAAVWKAGERLALPIALAPADSLPAAPAIAPVPGGALCVWESGPAMQRKLVASKLEWDGKQLRAGALEQPAENLEGVLLPQLCSLSSGSAGLVFSAQSASSLELFACTRTQAGWSPALRITNDNFDDWCPRIAADEADRLHIVSDRYDGQSFDVIYRVVEAGRVLRETAIAQSPGYEGLPDLALEAGGGAWIVWESAAQFGEIGPLRGGRQIGLCRVDEDGIRYASPASLPDARMRADFPRVLWSGSGPLVLFRSLAPPFHTAEQRLAGARRAQEPPPLRANAYVNPLANFYSAFWTRALSFDSRGESVLCEYPRTEGGNEHALSTLPNGPVPHALLPADMRGYAKDAPGRFGGSIARPARIALQPLVASEGLPPLTREAPAALRSDPPRAAEVERGDWLVGDLHRHTEASRCAGDQDGTTLDAIRYARGPGALDFLAISDHFQHLQVWDWWRARRDADRFYAPGRLVTFASVERAIPTRGHVNELQGGSGEWSFDPQTFGRHPWQGGRTERESSAEFLHIPHMTAREHSELPWTEIDWRPRLVELYQGRRGSYEGAAAPYRALDFNAPSGAVQAGLQAGHRFGFAGSSDHGASSDGFTLVQAASTRESIFEALCSGLAAAATTPAAFSTRWTAAQSDSLARNDLELELRGPAPVVRVDLFKNGELQQQRSGTGTREFWVLSSRRWGPYGSKPIQVRIEGANLLSVRSRQAGEDEAEFERSDDSFAFTKQRNAVDWVLEVEVGNATGSMTLQWGEDTYTHALDKTAPGAISVLPAPFEKEMLWRMGKPLEKTLETDSAAAGTSLLFEGLERGTDAHYYLRAAFADGNLLWAPIDSSAVAVETIQTEQAR